MDRRSTAWLRVLGVRRIVLHEDNDAAGIETHQQLSAPVWGFRHRAGRALPRRASGRNP